MFKDIYIIQSNIKVIHAINSYYRHVKSPDTIPYKSNE